MRPRGQSSGTDDLLPGSTFTARQVTAVVVAVLVATVLLPVGAQAAQLLNVAITDPGGVNQATVDSGGNLHVSGEVTLDSSAPVAVTSADDPEREAFQAEVLITITPGETGGGANIDVPAGKRLVITHLSGEVKLPAGQELIRVVLSTTGGEGDVVVVHHFVPTPTGTIGVEDVFAVSQETVIHDDGPQFLVSVTRNTNVDTGTAIVAVSGYLVDCSIAPCN